ncbi:MAG: hypothetical protein QM538_05445 [Methylacidiphilales bacterium]|nr:hypothetical protein [Candidatus Methylacidiphilales bacterium]
MKYLPSFAIPIGAILVATIVFNFSISNQSKFDVDKLLYDRYGEEIIYERVLMEDFEWEVITYITAKQCVPNSSPYHNNAVRKDLKQLTDRFGGWFLNPNKVYSSAEKTFRETRHQLPSCSDIEYAGGYTSAIGLHARIAASFITDLGLTFYQYYFLLSFLSSLLLVLLCYRVYKLFNPLYAVVFYSVSVLSPWFVAGASNLWVTMYSLLPAMIVASFATSSNKIKILIGIAIALAFKLLCHYEGYTTILLATATMYAIAQLSSAPVNITIKEFIVKALGHGIIVCVIGVGVFIGCLLLHAFLLAPDNFASGFKIIVDRLLWRTHGQGVVMDISTIKTTTLQIVNYYLTWRSWGGPELIYFINGRIFLVLVGIGLAAIIYRNYRNPNLNEKLFALAFVGFLVSTVSWYVLAAQHSYYHRHYLFILWYFGFVQTLFYVIIRSFALFLSQTPYASYLKRFAS